MSPGVGRALCACSYLPTLAVVSRVGRHVCLPGVPHPSCSLEFAVYLYAWLRAGHDQCALAETRSCLTVNALYFPERCFCTGRKLLWVAMAIPYLCVVGVCLQLLNI